MRNVSRLTLIMFLLVPVAVSAKIYKWVLPDGSVTYSDKPQEENATEVALPPLQTYSPPPTPARETGEDKDSDSSVATNYDEVKVVAPKPGESIRDNGGTISVQLAIEPALRAGHVVEILVDGKAIGSGRATSASVSNLDRGSHTISAVIKDDKDKVLANAPAVTFHLLRVSKLPPAKGPRAR